MHLAHLNVVHSGTSSEPHITDRGYKCLMVYVRVESVHKVLDSRTFAHCLDHITSAENRNMMVVQRIFLTGEPQGKLDFRNLGFEELHQLGSRRLALVYIASRLEEVVVYDCHGHGNLLLVVFVMAAKPFHREAEILLVTAFGDDIEVMICRDKHIEAAFKY